MVLLFVLGPRLELAQHYTTALKASSKDYSRVVCGLVFGLLTLRLERQVGTVLGNDMSTPPEAKDCVGLQGYLKAATIQTHTLTQANYFLHHRCADAQCKFDPEESQRQDDSVYRNAE